LSQLSVLQEHIDNSRIDNRQKRPADSASTSADSSER